MPADLPHRATPFGITFLGRTATMVRPANPDEVLGAITDEQFSRDEFLPYWAEHWPSASVLLGFLEKAPLPPDPVVCELGSGLGVIAAAVAGRASVVVATDISAEACRYALANLAAGWTDTSMAPAVAGGVAAHRGSVCCDWRTPAFRRPFDVIIGSDILYEKRWVTPIINFADQCLSATGTAYIADPCRSHWQPFLKECRERGFRADIVCRGKAGDEGKVTVEVARIARASAG